jgi:hypothetical protein
MLKNNLSAFLLYIGTNVLFYILFVWKDSMFQFQTSPVNLLIDALLSLLALWLFVWIGRSRFIENQGSKVENFFSVSLIVLIGFVIALASNPFQGPTLSIFYWGYALPFQSIMEMLKVVPVASNPLQFFYLFVASLLPSLLMWAGLQSKANKS